MFDEKNENLQKQKTLKRPTFPYLKQWS